MIKNLSPVLAGLPAATIRCALVRPGHTAVRAKIAPLWVPTSFHMLVSILPSLISIFMLRCEPLGSCFTAVQDNWHLRSDV